MQSHWRRPASPLNIICQPVYACSGRDIRENRVPTRRDVHLQADTFTSQAIVIAASYSKIADFTNPDKTPLSGKRTFYSNLLSLCSLNFGLLNLCRLFLGPWCFHTLSEQLGQELANSLLVNLVLWVLACTQQLGQPCTGLE